MFSKKFQICFVYPDFENLGVEYLMALCLHAGHKVNFVYYQADNSYLGKKQKTVSGSAVAKKVLATHPEIVAFSCVTDNFQYQLKCARAVKKINPAVIVVFGGIHPTAVPELVIKEKAVDAVVIGEADISFLDFLKNCQEDKNLLLPKKKVKGVVFKKNNKLIGQFKEGPLVNLDSLPFPFKEPFFPSIKVLAYEYRIITSRGCPYSCTYCFNSFIRTMRGQAVIIRQRSVDNVVKELLWAKEKYQIKKVFFIDDSFTTNKLWIAEFSRKYRRKINLPFACSANPDYIDKKVAILLKKAGCVFIQMGVQSLCQKINRDILHRVATKEKITQAIRDLKEVGIMVQVDHILGIPSDTIENQEEAVLYYNEVRPDLISVFWLIYYPKTPIIKTAFERGILTFEDINKIEKGERVVKGSIHDGGSLKDPGSFYSIQFLLNYLPFLPKWLVKFLIANHWYKIFGIRNYYLSTALPRAILCLVDKRNFTGRTLLTSFLNNPG